MRSGLLAEFGSAHEMLGALSRLEALGYRRLETYSPHPVPGTDEALGIRRSRLPWAVLGGGLLGASIGYVLQWYPNAVSYPLNTGGRPPHAVPAFVLVTFEMGVLLAALAAFVTLLALAGLPRLWHPVFEVEGFDRASIDRFWVGIDAGDPRFDPERSARDLEHVGASRVVVVGETP